MENALILIILGALVGAIVWYLIRSRRRYRGCVGCPYAKNCTSCSACHRTAKPSNDR